MLSRSLTALAVLVASLPLSCGSLASSAPDFRLPVRTGGMFQLSDHAGKDVVLLTFWSTRCEPCMRQMPFFSRLQKMYAQRGLVVAAVSIDSPLTRGEVSRAIANEGIDLPVLLDEDTTVVSRFNPHKDLPFTLLINRDGTIRTKLIRLYFTGDSAEMIHEVEAALADGATAPPDAGH